MKEDAPAPRDPDQPYLTLYCILASVMTSLGQPDLKAWIAQNKPAFDALSAGSPDRAQRLREIYTLHVASLGPHAVVTPAEPPAFTLPATDLVDAILSDGVGDDE
ncbi:hypothetical protein [Niveispirillum sp.]|uniref:hypothetical protein n=1 Tax=Niveispirillum sp. TaxID=1917217 RepID=UPI001B631FAC|nr:hypothetical protein [Niveispirillum sp.]MBP7338836.1 hypothetical protein [Niveispirillum sp.]